MTDSGPDERRAAADRIADIAARLVRSEGWRTDLQPRVEAAAKGIAEGELESPAVRLLLDEIKSQYGPEFEAAAADLVPGQLQIFGIGLTAEGELIDPALPKDAPLGQDASRLSPSMTNMLVAFGTIFPAIKDILSDKDQSATAQALAVTMSLVIAALLVDLLNRRR